MMVALRNALVGIKKQESGYWGLCFTAEEANSSIKLYKSVGTPPAALFSISYDGQIWQDYTEGDVIALTNVGDKVYFAARENTTNTKICGNARQVRKFTTTGLLAASGNIMSLFVNDEAQWQNVQIKGTIRQLFNDATITTAPELPAMDLSSADIGVYNGLFLNCSTLRIGPSILPETHSYANCYGGMFNGCSSLIKAPEIMLTENTSNGCLAAMFYGCTSLTEVKVHFTSWNLYGGLYTTRQWMYDVSSNGTLHCPVELGTNETIQRDITGNYCPEGWTVINDV